VQPIAEHLNIPHIATALGCDINHDLFDPRKRKQILNLLNSVSAITTVSSDLKNICIKEGIEPKKITPILNGVDISKFSVKDKNQCRLELNISKHDKVLIYIGRLSEEKNILKMINAFKNLALTSNINLHLIGDGPQRFEIAALIRDLCIDDRVYLHGNQPHEKIATWLGAANWLCLPSIREGCPNVVLEALASGLPVVASNVGAIPDLIDDQNGRLFEPHSVSSIEHAITETISQTWDSNIIAQRMKTYSWDSISEQYIKLYKRVMN
jgi:glycosyltransferase involved in cell wall biosynthesis